jgi:hypothetical protein
MPLINLRLSEVDGRLNLLEILGISLVHHWDFRNFFEFEEGLLNSRLFNKNAVIIEETGFLSFNFNDRSIHYLMI